MRNNFVESTPKSIGATGLKFSFRHFTNITIFDTQIGEVEEQETERAFFSGLMNSHCVALRLLESERKVLPRTGHEGPEGE